MNHMKMTAWPTGQQDIVRARIAAHRAADEIIQVIGWNGTSGCAIGCSLDDYDHINFANVLIGNNLLNDGVKIARLIDQLHEMLPVSVSLDWPGRVAHALKPGADTTHVLSRWFVWLLRVELREYAGHNEQIAALYERRIAGDEPFIKEWEDVAAVANAREREVNAAADATYSAAYVANANAVPQAALAAHTAYAHANTYASHSANTYNTYDAANAAVAAAHAAYAASHAAYGIARDGSYASRDAALSASRDAANAANTHAYNTPTRMADALIEIICGEAELVTNA